MVVVVVAQVAFVVSRSGGEERQGRRETKERGANQSPSVQRSRDEMAARWRLGPVPIGRGARRRRRWSWTYGSCVGKLNKQRRSGRPETEACKRTKDGPSSIQSKPAREMDVGAQRRRRLFFSWPVTRNSVLLAGINRPTCRSGADGRHGRRNNKPLSGRKSRLGRLGTKWMGRCGAMAASGLSRPCDWGWDEPFLIFSGPLRTSLSMTDPIWIWDGQVAIQPCIHTSLGGAKSPSLHGHSPRAFVALVAVVPLIVMEPSISPSDRNRSCGRSRAQHR